MSQRTADHLPQLTSQQDDLNVSSSAEGEEGEKQTVFFILLILILLPMMQAGIT